MFLGCISLQGNSLLSPASPIHPHRAQRSGLCMRWSHFIASNPSEIRSREFSDANLCQPQHSPEALPCTCFEEPCRLTSAIHKELVHATWAQGGPYSFSNHLAGTDVTYKLGDALGAISALFQQDNRCGLGKKEQLAAFKNHLLQ